MAGDVDNEGRLPCVGDMAWRLRASEDELLADLEALQDIGIISMNGQIHIVTNFVKRQAPVSNAERQARYRDRKRFNNDDITNEVTNRNTDTDTDTESEDNTLSASADAPPSPNADYLEMLKVWGELFPSKPQPRPNTKSLQQKVKTRMKEKEFRENWRAALERVKDSKFCLNGSWFQFSWFVKNDEHWQRCFNGNYDNAPPHKGNGRTPPKQEFRTIANDPLWNGAQ
jgi:hypothetical protein